MSEGNNEEQTIEVQVKELTKKVDNLNQLYSALVRNFLGDLEQRVFSTEMLLSSVIQEIPNVTTYGDDEDKLKMFEDKVTTILKQNYEQMAKDQQEAKNAENVQKETEEAKE